MDNPYNFLLPMMAPTHIIGKRRMVLVSLAQVGACIKYSKRSLAMLHARNEASRLLKKFAYWEI